MMNKNMIKKQKSGLIVLASLIIMMIALIAVMVNYDYESEHYTPDVIYEMCDKHIIGP